MSTLEDKLKKHQRSFDHREPQKDHLARFILKLEADQEKQQRRSSPWFIVKIAASVIVLITAGYLTLNFLFNNTPVNREVQLISYSPEMNNAMAYYDEASLAKMNVIDDLVENNEEAMKIKQTAYSSLEDLDMRLAAIEKEYMKNPGNSALQAALINNKRKKVEVMDRIIMQIDFANTQLY
jgi:hypothetical protein